MALELASGSLAVKSTPESLDLISGADDNKLIQAGETFVGTIMGFVVQDAGTITEVLAADTDGTDIVGAGGQGYLNITGTDLVSGAFFAAGKYSGGANYTSLTTGTASVIVYYKYTKDNG